MIGEIHQEHPGKVKPLHKERMRPAEMPSMWTRRRRRLQGAWNTLPDTVRWRGHERKRMYRCRLRRRNIT